MLLELVSRGVDRLDQLSAESGLSRSSAHRMLTSLVGRRYLTLGLDNRYRLGVALLDLGTRAAETLNLPDAVQAQLGDLSQATSDASHIGILDDLDILYLAKARGHRGIDMASRPGVRFRAQHTAMGKALLSHVPDAEALTYFDAAQARTERSITSGDQFLRVLHEAKDRGFALDDQENELGITCVAVAVPDLSGAFTAAISVSAPSVYMTPERIAEVVTQIHRVQPEITAYLTPGYAAHWL